MAGLQKSKIDFNNTEIAFKHKSDAELRKAYWLFKVIGSNFLTQIGPPITNFMLRIGLPIQGVIKATIFKQFCGGQTIADCDHAIAQLHKGKVGTILDYSVEGEEEEQVFDFTCEEIIRTINRAKGDLSIPITVFKITGIGQFDLLAKVNAKASLTAAGAEAFERVKERCMKICQTAFQFQVPIMIDAEETWIQDTIDGLALDMMRHFNKEKLTVYNTYQIYRHDKLASIKADYAIAKAEGFILGVKVVRGAYMEKERKRAVEMGYPSPIQPDKAATDRDYNAALQFCVSEINGVALVCGTHNEESCMLLTNLIDQYQIPHHHPHLYFAQLLGMSDNLTFNLADAGYNVTKYVPYGPIKAVMPYLFRRAQENTSVAGQTGRELALIDKEMKRRKL